MHKRISIHGCSWTQGEWHQDGGYKLHGGLETYLMQAGHYVRNMGRAGDSNHSQIAKMRDLWAHGPRPDFSVVILTDITRDLNHVAARDTDTPEDYMRRQLENYQREIALCERVLVVGGLHVIQPEQAQEWPCVKYCNWFDLLPLSETWQEHWPEYFVNYATVEEHQTAGRWPARWPQSTRQIQGENHDTAWRVLVKNRQWFWPDGFHPNRDAHRKLADWVLGALF